MSPANSQVRRTVHFSGQVQGVGFRYTTRSIARGYPVTGYVRNLPDRQVELVAEGEPSDLTAFLAEIHDHLGDHIRSQRIDTQAASGEFAGFEIRH
jgi:acylphosphatase